MISIFVFLSSMLFSQLAAVAEPNAEEIVRKADQRRLPTGSVAFKATVKDYEEESLARETSYQVRVNSADSSLVETVYPERQRGRKLLMEKDNLWLYTPDVRRAARVSMQQRLSGEVANGDLARTNFSGDYSAKLIGKKKIGGDDVYHLDLRARRDNVTYSRIEYWVRVSDLLPVKAVFFAVSGKPLKTGVYLEPKTILGKRCITKVMFSDAVDKKRKSVLTYSSIQRERFPAGMFSKESLESE